MSLYDEIARRLKEEREAAKLTQVDLAKRLEVASNTVSRWETGVSRPDLDDLERMARVLGIGVAELIPQNSANELPQIEKLLSLARRLPSDELAELMRFAEFQRLKRR